MKLLIYRGDTLERTLELTDRDVRIGRGAENDVVLEDPEKTVSRFHAELRPEQGGYVLFDLNSQNGIWIDGQRIQRQTLNPGQNAQLGNFRIIIDGGALATMPPAEAAPEAMAATMMLSREAAMAAAPGGAAPSTSASAPTSPGGPPPPPPPAQIQAAVAPRRPKLAPTGAEGKKGFTSIPRPIFYGGALVFLLLIIGVMYVMRPHPPQPEPEPPAQPAAQQPGPTQPGTPASGTTAATTTTTPEPATPTGPETNEQIVARYIKEGKDKLDAGDPVAAIEAFNRALMIDPSQADALDLKMKAEERRHQQASTQSTVGSPTSSTTTATTKPGTTTPDPAAKPGTGTTGASGTQTASTGTTTTPRAGTATTDSVKPVPDKAAIAAARKEKAARDATAALQRRYTLAKAEMSRGDYEHAIADFEAVLREKPGYQDAASQLDQAKGLRRADAQKSMGAATAAAGKGDFAAAMRGYERTAKIDPSYPGVQDGIAGVRKQMHDAGEQAYRRARQLDAVGRTQDALPLYLRAVELLPADDPSGKAARDRLDALKGQNP